MTAAIVLLYCIYFYAIAFESQEKVPETRVPAKICTADGMSLSLFVFTQLFSEVARSQPAKPARKQNLTRNGQSRSFNLIYFGVFWPHFPRC